MLRLFLFVTSIFAYSAIGLMAYLFEDGESPRAPYPDCGDDPSADDIGCADPPACR